MSPSPPSPDERLNEVLRERDFVHGLARRLLRDDDRAGDVAQEALVIASRETPRGSLRGFLASVVRNLAASDLRSSARRARREREVARPESGVPSAQAIVEREEWRRRILRAVEELPASQREAILLRYFEGLPPRRIAKQLDIPVESVKTRIQRGLAKLRPRLEAEHGEPDTWNGLALVAVAPSLAGSLGLSMGAFGMTSTLKWKVTAAACVVAGAVWFGWSALRGDSGTLELDEPGARAELVIAADDRHDANTPEPPAGGTRVAADPAPARTVPKLVGRVLLRGTEEPVPGVEVSFLVDGAVGLARTTDDEGRFEHESELERHYTRAFIAAGATTQGESYGIDHRYVPGESSELILHVSRGTRISGRVVNEDGDGVAGVTVRGKCTSELLQEPELDAADRETTTDEDGHFTLTHLGPRFRIEAYGEGLLGGYDLAGNSLGREHLEGLVLLVVAPRDMEVFVHDSNAQPVEGARVRVSASQPLGSLAQTQHPEVYRVPPRKLHARSDTTDAAGIATFPAMPLTAVQIEVEHDDYVDQDYLDRFFGDRKKVQLVKGPSVFGRVLRPNGSGAAGATVRLQRRTRTIETRTGADGSFRFENVIDGPFDEWLGVEAGGFAALVHEPVAFDEELLLRLEPAVALGGTVRSPDGGPAAGVRVSILGDRFIAGYLPRSLAIMPTWETQGRAALEMRTDENGRFDFDGLYEGKFEVFLHHDDGGHQLELLDSGFDGYELVFDAARSSDVSFEGRVTDAVTGDPIRDFQISVLGVRNGATYNSRPLEFHDEDGRYAIRGLPTMKARLWVHADGYRTPVLPYLDREPGVVFQDVKMVEARSISVRVVDQDGAARYATIRALDADGQHVWIRSSPTTNQASVDTMGGEAVLHGLPATEVTLHVHVPKSMQVHWPEGSRSDWEFPLNLTVPLEGTQVLEIEVPKY